MNYLADLHTHSLYSRATSASSNLFGLAAWATVKGLAVIATGDFTHPAWFAHLHDTLEEAEPGFFTIKKGLCTDWHNLIPPGLRLHHPPESIRFVLSAEISSIYKRGGRVRKVHNLLYAPDFASVQRINTRLAALGNIHSDGRPILGLDSRDLLDIFLHEVPDGFLVPAHIWTPWFSLFGSKSGFDSVEECFGDLSQHIFALETGLSSDPEMNRHISALDRFTLISNSDCHSPSKLGREANLLDTDCNYFALRKALQSPLNEEGQQVFAATVEFYPEEGKYHADGHRRCGVCLAPAATREAKGLCPHCGKPLTIGVLHRVMELADRDQPIYPKGSPAVYSLIPLQEIIAELLACGSGSKKVGTAYTRLLNVFGSEFNLLLNVAVEEIRAQGFLLLAEAISRIRNNQVHRQPGYDGEFGQIKVFAPGERLALLGQGMLFAPPEDELGQNSPKRTISKNPQAKKDKKNTQDKPDKTKHPLNTEQQQAVDSPARIILVQAGPGTGKTHTLTSRVRRIVLDSPLPCTVITFTTRAAAELRERLRDVADQQKIQIHTFHGYCLAQLRRMEPGLQVVGPEERKLLVAELFPHYPEKRHQELIAHIARSDVEHEDAKSYHHHLAQRALIDLDAIIPRTVEILQQDHDEAQEIRKATGHLLIDEFQDVNAWQYQLSMLLAQNSTLFAIGDPDQAIYSFRGADPQWFFALAKEPASQCHRLIRNYRNGERIIRAASAMIQHNPRPDATPMQASGKGPGMLCQQVCTGSRDEANFIADQVEAHLGGISHRSLERINTRQGKGQKEQAGGSYSFRDFAVLYRTTRQAQIIAKVLAERGIPFQIVELEAFYTKGPCRILYAWLLLLTGLAEIEDWLFLLALEKGLGKRSLGLIASHLRAFLADGKAKHLAEDENQNASQILLHIRALQGISKTAASACAGLASLYERLLAQSTTQKPETLLLTLGEHYQLDMQEADLRRLRELALAHGASLKDLASYLHSFSDSVHYEREAEAVSLSTLHAAKGLEFPVVFIAGLEEELMPLRLHASDQPDQAHIEEERRLFYVGMTRAIDHLWLSWRKYPQRHDDRGSESGKALLPSPFLQEIPPDLFSPLTARARKKRNQGPRQLSLFPETT